MSQNLLINVCSSSYLGASAWAYAGIGGSQNGLLCIGIAVRPTSKNRDKPKVSPQFYCSTRYLYIGLSVCLYVCMSVYTYACFFVCRSIFPFVYLAVFMFVCLPASLSVCLYVCLSIYSSVYLLVCLSASLPTKLVSPCMPLCLSAYILVHLPACQPISFLLIWHSLPFLEIHSPLLCSIDFWLE